MLISQRGRIHPYPETDAVPAARLDHARGAPSAGTSPLGATKGGKAGRDRPVEHPGVYPQKTRSSPWRSAVFVGGLCLAAGCGGASGAHEQNEADAGLPDGAGPAWQEDAASPSVDGGVLSEAVVAHVGVSSHLSEGRNRNAPVVWARVFDGSVRILADRLAIPVALHEVAVSEGDCEVLLAVESACSPPCGVAEHCGADNRCHPSPNPLSAGEILVQAGSESITLPVPAAGHYQDVALSSVSALDGAVNVRASGGAFPGFFLSVEAVPAAFELEGTDDGLVFGEGAELEVRWKSAGSGVVQLVLLTGWHGAPPSAILLCEAPDSAGKITIGRGVGQAFALALSAAALDHGEPHSSWISRVGRARATLDQGAVELAVMRMRYVSARLARQAG